jgi:hypothetical protein
MKPYRPQHDRPAACVIAQQYSSVTLHLIAIPITQGKIRRALKKKYYFNFPNAFKLR